MHELALLASDENNYLLRSSARFGSLEKLSWQNYSTN